MADDQTVRLREDWLIDARRAIGEDGSNDEEHELLLEVMDAFPHPTNPVELPPADVVACGADPGVPLCPACIDAYRNGIEPGETACEARAKQ